MERTKLFIILAIIVVIFLVVSLLFPFDALEKARAIQSNHPFFLHGGILVQKI